MKKLASLCLALLLVFSLTSFQPAIASNNSDVVAGEYVVSFNMDNNSNTILSQINALKDLGLDVEDSMVQTAARISEMFAATQNHMSDMINTMGSLHLVKFEGSNLLSQEAQMASIKAQLEEEGYTVNYIEPNYEVRAFESAQSYTLHSNQAWHYNMINIPTAWNTTIGSRSVKAAIIDSGIQANHPNLVNNVNTSLCRSYVEGDSSYADAHGHGTHVAGTVGAHGSSSNPNISGVNRLVTLFSVRTLGDDGRGQTYWSQQGVTYAADSNADVINMSLGGGSFSQAFQDACTYAVNQGTVVVAATGNEQASQASYPALYDNVIGVGALKSNGQRDSSYSNYGPGLDISAPGTDIYSTWLNGGTNTISGTSMATPHVTGVVALMRAANPNATVAQITNTIFDTAVQVGSAQYYGAGKIDAAACVAAMVGGTTPDPVDPPTPPTPEDPDPVTSSLTIEAEYSADYSKIYQDITVTDSNGNPVSGVALSLRLTTPTGKTLTGSTTTASDGTARFSLRYANYGEGNYTYNLTATKAGYDTATYSRTVTLQ